jgi:hypothetical protein
MLHSIQYHCIDMCIASIRTAEQNTDADAPDVTQARLYQHRLGREIRDWFTKIYNYQLAKTRGRGRWARGLSGLSGLPGQWARDTAR